MTASISAQSKQTEQINVDVDETFTDDVLLVKGG